MTPGINKMRACGVVDSTRFSLGRVLLRDAVIAGTWMVASLAALANAGPAESAEVPPRIGFGSRYCGPRCVQRVLREYGVETDLVDLIRKYRQIAESSEDPLGSLAVLLGEQRISTRIAHIDPKTTINWTHPAIVALEQGGKTHYVVWMPSMTEDTTGRVWDGELTDAVLASKFDSLRSGAVLFTSDRPIADSDLPGRRVIAAGRELQVRRLLPWLLGIGSFACGWMLQWFGSRSRKRLAGVLLVGMLSCTSSARADEGSSLPMAVRAIRENANRLHSGQYRANGHLESTHWNEGPKYEKRDLRHDEFEETVEADFDFDTNRSSFRSRRVNLGAPAPRKSTLETYRWYLEIPGLSVTLKGTEQRRTAALRLPTPWTEIWPNELTQRQPQPVFDPRLLGWVGLGFLGEPFQDLWENWFVKAELKSADEGAGIHRIEMWKPIEEGMSVVQTCWCDEQQGWQPVRSAFRWVYSAPTQNAEQRNREPQPLNETEQSWEQHGDVWVIKSLSARLEAGSTKSSLQMTFDWKNVNQPIPEERFDWKSWDFGRDYHSLVDMRLGDGKEIDITDRRAPPYEVDLDRPLVASEEDQGRFWMVLVNVVAISFLAGWVGSGMWKRR